MTHTCSIKTFLALFVFFICMGKANANVYDDQVPMEEKELVSFIKIMPQFRKWAASAQEGAAPAVIDGKADFIYSEKTAQWLRERGWQPKRFFFLMGKAAAGIYILAEGSEIKEQRPKDMPSLSQEELNLVSQYLAELLNIAGNSESIR